MDTRPMKRLLTTGALLAVVAGCAAKPEGNGADPSVALLGPADVARVTRTDLATGLPVTGTLKPERDVTLTAPYPELVETVMVKEGQTVKQGQPLARLRTESLAPAAASAESQRSMAATDYERMKNLFREGAVSQRDLDNAQSQLRAAESAAAYADKRLKEATVRAPFDGVVARRVVQGGDRLGDGGVMFRVVNTAGLEFEASVPGEAVGVVHVGAPVTLSVNGLEGVTIHGRIARVNATADPATRQVRVYATVPNTDGRLVGDLFASGRVQLGQAAGVLTVPSTGVRTAADGSASAWLVVDGHAEKRAVVAGLRDEVRDLVEVRSGLKEGEAVVVGPIETLTPGMKVQVVQDATPAAPAKRPAGKGK